MCRQRCEIVRRHQSFKPVFHSGHYTKKSKFCLHCKSWSHCFETRPHMSGVPEILIEPEMSRRRRRRAWRFATRVTQGTLCLANFCCSWTARPWRRRCDESSERPELHSKQHGVMSHRHVSPSGATVQTAWRHFSRSSEWCAMVCHIRTFRLYSRLPFWPPRAAPVRAPLLQAVIRRCLTVAAPLLSPVSHGGSTTPADRQSPVSHCGSTTPAGRQSPVSHRGSTATVAGVSLWKHLTCRPSVASVSLW